jgi:hypothetical protein
MEFLKYNNNYFILIVITIFNYFYNSIKYLNYTMLTIKQLNV